MSAKTSSEKPSTEKVPGGKNVLVEFEDQVAWVTLNRPEKRNCMSPALNDEMVEVLDALELDDRCGVLVLTGAWPTVAEDFVNFETGQVRLEARDQPLLAEDQGHPLGGPALERDAVTGPLVLDHRVVALLGAAPSQRALTGFDLAVATVKTDPFSALEPMLKLV